MRAAHRDAIPVFEYRQFILNGADELQCCRLFRIHRGKNTQDQQFVLGQFSRVATEALLAHVLSLRVLTDPCRQLYHAGVRFSCA